MDTYDSIIGTRETRYWILFFIILAVSIFLVIALNNIKSCSRSPVRDSLSSIYGKRNTSLHPEEEITEVQPTQIGLDTIFFKGEDGKTRFKYEYRLWPERSFQDPDNYAFYSMYGWRMNPPYEYPQSTINTAYDEAIRNCNCSPAEGNEDCISKCRFQALIAAGFPSMFHQ